MSKPRIYGTCPAGCLWETVHIDDFLRSASIVKQTEQAEGYVLEAGRTYKVRKRFDGATTWGFAFAIWYSYQVNSDGEIVTRTQSVDVELPETTKFDDYAKIKICGYTFNKTLVIVYEFNGVRSEIDVGAFSHEDDDGITLYGTIQDSSEVFVYNEDATIYGATGASIVSTVLKGQNANGDNIYEQTFDNGVTAGFVAPKGDTGDTGAQGEKGDTGAKVVSTVLTGQDENGGNIYEQTFDDGTRAEFVAPKGDAGEKGERGERGERGEAGSTIVTNTLIGQDENGGNIYRQVFSDGSTADFTAPKGDKGEQGEKGEVPIVQTTGDSKTAVMSQREATEQILRGAPYFEKYEYSALVHPSAGFYKASDGSYYVTSAYNAIKLKVRAHDIICVTSTYGSNAHIANFYNGEPSAETFVGIYGEKSSEDVAVVDQLIEIPDGVEWATFNSRINTTFEVKKQVVNPTHIYFDLKNEVLRVATKYYYARDLVVTFRKKGGNNLPDFGTFETKSNYCRYPKADFSEIYPMFSTGSDYHGPLVVRTVNNRDGDNIYSQHWTGGNHEYTNSGINGTPTARCISLEFWVDGEKITEGSGFCENILIKWTNMVQAYTTKKEDGTGREVLQENHELVFDGYEWKSYVEWVALEDVVIERYYGFQYGGIAKIYPKVRYIDGANRFEYDASSVATKSGDNKCSLIHGYGDIHEIFLELDTNFGLGKREHYNGDEGANTQTYGKAYFYVIFEDTPLLAGEMVAMRGKYMFRSRA